ncbi:hypothetical protein L3X38_026841 [Prunus dulcis]|uniref:Reverse transcriptase Ty1/copia-type domain-containing protein n=1 Tax=Prunus dulcis TaxID=3755 RepID=A0AAD4YZT6_PRUDU|nr:hypothetical protein L3X38_026841 [Prunus dulcis]
MKNLGEATFVFGIEIQRHRARGLLSLSQKTYIESILKRFDIKLVGYADANLGKAEDDYISTSGFLFKMAGAAVA